LRRLIKEQTDDWYEPGDGKWDDYDDDEELASVIDEDPTDMAQILLRNNRNWKQGRNADEVYIMTGEAEGITVKVMRRGR